MNYKITYLLIALFSVLSSCKKSDMEPNGPVSKNTLSFNITLSEQTIVETRSGTNDKTISNLYVFVFDGNQDNSQLVDFGECFVVGNTYYATLKSTTTSGYIQVFANVANEINALTATTLGQMRMGLLVKLGLSDGNIIEDPDISPMSSELLDFTSGFPDSHLLNVELTRATAKVTVVNKTIAQQNYVMQGSNIGNAPALGYVIGGVGQVVSPNLAHYAGLDHGSAYSVEKMMASAAIDPSTGYEVSSLFMFESVKANKTFVIIKGLFNGIVGYHRLNIWDRVTEIYMDIDRNSQYIVNVTKVHTPGYATAREAINSAGSNRNVDFEIVVTDPDAHDIITNGEQYLSCTNSSFIQYNSQDMLQIIATTINFTVPKGAKAWNDGTMTAVGEGLEMANSQKVMPLPAVDTKDLDVSVNMLASFTKGYVDIRIGDLAKRITIEKRPSLPAVAEEIEFEDAIVGDRTEAGVAKNAIRFASESGKYADKDDYNNVFVSTTNKVYALIASNIGYRDNIAERSSWFYITSSKDAGRTKVAFNQLKMDIYTSLVQIRPNTYVGTFHRADETAERIIRILPAKADANVTWSAIVVAGQDFIELDISDSPDTGISKYNTYGYDPKEPNNTSKWDNPRWTTAADVEANCQFKPEQKGKVSVTGKGDLIYFRVGMKSKLPGGATAMPRYGLISVQHVGGSHLIYVRQGEAADYLMRPADGILDNNILSGSRPNAKKVQPYNLTVPLDKRDLKFYDIPTNGAVLTDYPSKGGYLFPGDSQRAFLSVGLGKDVNWTNNSSSTAGSDEVCPLGYRRPADGVSMNTEGNIVGSEMRQSFWLNPQKGEAVSSFSNMLRGYIADGYYDRRVMRVPNTQGHVDEGLSIYKEEKVTVNGITTTYTIPTMVGEGSEIGYAGMLIFNPNNYASIFIPATGSREGQLKSGDVVGTGAQSNFWSSTNYNPNQKWYLATGYYINKFVFDNYYSSFSSRTGLSVRCVKESND